tara:strand:+ start:824 stop:1111 length:288 start_codon:yes stop_codon:yes gene_type:complete
MPFQFVDVSKDTVLKPSSRKLYRALLNKISKEGYTTQQELMDNSKKVIEYIEKLYNDNRKKRVMMSAIFYILCDTEYIKSTNPYHTYFGTLKDSY